MFPSTQDVFKEHPVSKSCSKVQSFLFKRYVCELVVMLCLLKGLFVFRNAEFICFFSEILQRNVAITCTVTVQLFFRGFYVRMGFDTIIGYCVLKFRVFGI